MSATGAQRQIGKIGAALRTAPLAVPSPKREVDLLVRVMGSVGLAVSILVVVLLGVLRVDWIDGLLRGTSVGMSMLPEEFPLVLTVFIVMGAWRLSASPVLARRSDRDTRGGHGPVHRQDRDADPQPHLRDVAGP